MEVAKGWFESKQTHRLWEMNMAKSFGGALLEGVPILIRRRTTKKGVLLLDIPEIWYREGDEKRALDLLENMDVIKKVIMPNKPANAKV